MLIPEWGVLTTQFCRFGSRWASFAYVGTRFVTKSEIINRAAIGNRTTDEPQKIGRDPFGSRPKVLFWTLSKADLRAQLNTAAVDSGEDRISLPAAVGVVQSVSE